MSTSPATGKLPDGVRLAALVLLGLLLLSGSGIQLFNLHVARQRDTGFRAKTDQMFFSPGVAVTARELNESHPLAKPVIITGPPLGFPIPDRRRERVVVEEGVDVGCYRDSNVCARLNDINNTDADARTERAKLILETPEADPDSRRQWWDEKLGPASRSIGFIEKFVKTASDAVAPAHQFRDCLTLNATTNTPSTADAADTPGEGKFVMMIPLRLPSMIWLYEPPVYRLYEPPVYRHHYHFNFNRPIVCTPHRSSLLDTGRRWLERQWVTPEASITWNGTHWNTDEEEAKRTRETFSAMEDINRRARRLQDLYDRRPSTWCTDCPRGVTVLADPESRLPPRELSRCSAPRAPTIPWRYATPEEWNGTHWTRT